MGSCCQDGVFPIFRPISNVFLEKESQKIHLCQSLAKTTLSTTSFVRCIGRHLSSDSPSQDFSFITPRSAWLPSHLSNRNFFFIFFSLLDLESADLPEPMEGNRISARDSMLKGYCAAANKTNQNLGKRIWIEGLEVAESESSPLGGRVPFWLLPPTPPAISAGAPLVSLLTQGHTRAHARTHTRPYGEY